MLDSAEDLDRKRICRIVTRDFPQYFAVVSRVKQDSHLIGPEGGVLSSTVVPQVQAVFPEGALTKRIRVGLQVRCCAHAWPGAPWGREDWLWERGGPMQTWAPHWRAGAATAHSRSLTGGLSNCYLSPMLEATMLIDGTKSNAFKDT